MEQKDKRNDRYKEDDNPDFIEGDYFALIIANANYEDEKIRDLKNPIKDSQTGKKFILFL